jgi:hypothetical protein
MRLTYAVRVRSGLPIEPNDVRRDGPAHVRIGKDAQEAACTVLLASFSQSSSTFDGEADDDGLFMLSSCV